MCALRPLIYRVPLVPGWQRRKLLNLRRIVEPGHTPVILLYLRYDILLLVIGHLVRNIIEIIAKTKRPLLRPHILLFNLGLSEPSMRISRIGSFHGLNRGTSDLSHFACSQLLPISTTSPSLVDRFFLFTHGFSRSRLRNRLIDRLLRRVEILIARNLIGVSLIQVDCLIHIFIVHFIKIKK